MIHYTDHKLRVVPRENWTPCFNFWKDKSVSKSSNDTVRSVRYIESNKNKITSIKQSFLPKNKRNLVFRARQTIGGGILWNLVCSSNICWFYRCDFVLIAFNVTYTTQRHRSKASKLTCLFQELKQGVQFSRGTARSLWSLVSITKESFDRHSIFSIQSWMMISNSDKRSTESSVHKWQISPWSMSECACLSFLRQFTMRDFVQSQ